MRAFGRVAAGVAVLAAAAGLSACASIKDHRGYLVDQALVDAVQPGIDNRQSVGKSLGRPTFVSEFGHKDWYYLSQTTKQAAFTRPRTAEQTVLKISFDAGGNVSGVQKSGMEHVVLLNPDGHKTPTLGKDRSFLEDLFGNIGQVGAGGQGQDGSNSPAPGRGPNGS